MLNTEQKIHAFLNPGSDKKLPGNKYKAPRKFKFPRLFFQAKDGEELGQLLTRTIYFEK